MIFVTCKSKKLSILTAENERAENERNSLGVGDVEEALFGCYKFLDAAVNFIRAMPEVSSGIEFNLMWRRIKWQWCG